MEISAQLVLYLACALWSPSTSVLWCVQTCQVNTTMLLSIDCPPTFVGAGQLASFEAPVVGVGGYQYHVEQDYTAGQPWLFDPPSLAGIAADESPFDPPCGDVDPDGTQYGFLQASQGFPVSISTAIGPVNSSAPVLSFYYAQRATDVNYTLQLSVSWAGAVVWNSPNLIVANGWTPISVNLTTPTTSDTTELKFTVTPGVLADQTLLLDAILVS